MNTKTPSGRMWPWLVVAILASAAGTDAVMVYVAVSDPSFALVEDSYYEKGLAWDQHMEEQAASRALGWSASARFGSRGADGSVPLAVAVFDGAGVPVDGATLSVRAFPYARATQILERELLPAGRGLYAANVRASRSGLWRVSVRAERGAEQFVHDLMVSLP